MAHPIFGLAERVTEEMAALDPHVATYEGVVGYDDRWPDLSPEGATARLDAYRRFVAEIDALAPGDSKWERLAVRSCRDFLADFMLDWLEQGEYRRDLNSISCPVQDLHGVFDVMDKTSPEGWEAIVARLEGLPRALAGYRATLEDARRRGETVAQRQVEAVVRQARHHAGPESALRDLPDQATSAAGPDRIGAGVEAACRAFGELAEYLERDYLPDANAEDAVGEERYLTSARRYLGGTIDPVEIYRWGWSEVERIRSEMAEVAGRISPGAPIPEVIERLKSDPAGRSSDRDEFVAVMTQRLHQAVHDLDGTAFEIPEPLRAVEVKIAPPGGPLGAYYIGPSEDFRRPGTVWYSLDPQEHQVAYYNQVSTNYHEGFPGHHLQVGYPLTVGDVLTRLQRTFVWYPGYGEGWALYAELVMKELGYLEKLEYVFGMLAEAMLRACRVVIDIGSHMEFPIPDEQPFHPGERWSFDTAVEMLIDYALQPPPYARSEVTRYLGWPGQAIAYKVGEREILKMRDELMARDGEGFDLMDFHDRVLTPGAIGLDHLRDLVVG